MAKQLMIYENVVPLSKERHADLCVETGLPYDFAKQLRFVPLVASEISHAAREYTVVIAPAGNQTEMMPFAVLGINENENLYVAEDGEWTAGYIPAFIRRYPFVFSTSPDGTQYTLCIDENWRGCNRQGRGERLFDEQGNTTEFLNKLVKFNEGYQRSFQSTTLFCKRLLELELLDAKEAKLTLPNGQESKLSGFFFLNRERVNSLSGEHLADLAKRGALEMIYAQLMSINNLGTFAQRIRGSEPTEHREPQPSAPAN